ncbi:MAG TPA: TetR/AcrR family transcriptional regulator [Xanthobacteraceae bacterium]|nr:TetR/AcrR family transcriptional regulator [Xanthobacteraceae bacterium]
MAYRRTERVLQHLAARHEAIIAAAQAIAAEQGLGAVQIVPVAERAGIAAGTVYRYFPAKADLVAALIEAVSARELAAFRKAADAAPGPLSALAAGLIAFSARALRHRRLAWAINAEPVDAAVEALRLTARRALAAEIETRVRAAVAGGHLPEQDAGAASAALVGLMLEGLIGPLAPATAVGTTRANVQTYTLLALRALGVVDARARGLVVQTAVPDEDAA